MRRDERRRATRLDGGGPHRGGADHVAHAAHASGDASLGLASWHSIHGPVLGHGRDDATPLQRWCLEHPVVPLLRDVLESALAPGAVTA